MNTNILSSNGRPSAYGLSCGYIDRIETNTLHKELYKEHGIYHVRSLRNNTPELNTKFDGKTSHKYIIWMSYYKLSDARKLFNSIR